MNADRNYHSPIAVWLFDIDGVLIYPGGYRAALKATVNHFSRLMGLGDLAPDDDTIEAFEACRLTSEWDSAPVCVAAMVAEAALADPTLEFSADFWRTAEAIRARGFSEMRPDFRSLARRVAEESDDGDLPGLIALRLLTDELKSRARLDGRAEGLFGALGQLLADTRDFPRAPAMFIFQHFTLGSRGFAETYHLPPTFESPSFIHEYDRSALSPESLARLKHCMANGLRASIITARPSLAPRDLVSQPSGFAPEAEMAVQLVGLDGVPLIGYGRLQWLEGETGKHAETLLKPSPVHALAAIGAALFGQEAASLRAAYRLVERNEVDPLWQDLVGASLAIHVFEDSAGGVRSTQAAGEWLRSIGVRTETHAWGVTTHIEKKASLERLGARVFGDVNEAVGEAEQRMRGM